MQLIPPRIIIEGSNYCGKDAMLATLLQTCKNAVVIRTSGYYRKALQAHGTEALSQYFRERSEAHLPLIAAVKHDELLIVRLHLTDIVYCQLYLGIVQDYRVLDDELNRLKVGLVLLDVDDATLEARHAANPRGTSGHADRSLPTLIEKRDLFRQAFAQSGMTRRLLLHNNNGGSTLDEQTAKILEWWRSVA